MFIFFRFAIIDLYLHKIYIDAVGTNIYREYILKMQVLILKRVIKLPTVIHLL
jgi:hypothetical protein